MNVLVFVEVTVNSPVRSILSGVSAVLKFSIFMTAGFISNKINRKDIAGRSEQSL